ncbi:MAG: hypothetical protein WC332_00645 [Clostridia bacterium]|jgi:hypothetical protein
MTDNQKKLIFEYCGWCQHEWDRNNPYNDDICKICGKLYFTVKDDHLLDGNDILEAVKIMESKGDWGKFYAFYNKIGSRPVVLIDRFIPYLLQNFFPLMAEWLEVRK